MRDRPAASKDWHRGGNAAAARGRRDLGEGLGSTGNMKGALDCLPGEVKDCPGVCSPLHNFS